MQSKIFYRDIFTRCEKIPLNYEVAEKLCEDAFLLCRSDGDLYQKKIDNLLAMDVEFLKLQASLEKNGRYLYSTFEEVEREVFKKKKTDNEYGVDYLWGLYFSQVFWTTHHRVLNFLLKEFIYTSGTNGRFLDAPVGSGVFSTQFLLANPLWRGVGVDLSKTAIDLAEGFLKINGLEDRIELVQDNFFTFTSEDPFDRIMCIEFIEHVEDPLAVLRKLRTLLSDRGEIFLMTVAWAAHIDHIYLYRNADEIRDHIRQSGLQIEKEYVQNIFDKDNGKLQDSKVALNYAAILTK